MLLYKRLYIIRLNKSIFFSSMLNILNILKFIVDFFFNFWYYTFIYIFINIKVTLIFIILIGVILWKMKKNSQKHWKQ